MRKEKKIATVEELQGLFGEVTGMVVSDYRGLNVEKITVLRNGCRTSGAEFRVVKNTLVKKALAGSRFQGTEVFFDGPSAMTTTCGDAVAVVRVLTDFAKENEALDIKGGQLDGVVYSREEIFRIATLPSREVLLGRLVGSLSSPMSRMVGTLGNPLRGLVGVLGALGRSRGGN